MIIIDFRKIKSLYLAFIILGLVLAVVLFLFTQNFLYPILVITCFMTLGNYIFKAMLEKRYQKMDRLLYNECNSELYLKSVDASIVAAKAARMYGPGTQVSILGRKATALVNLGRFKEARDCLSRAKVSKKSIVAKAEYYNSMIPCFSSTKDSVGEAQRFLDEMKKVIDDPAFPKMQKPFSEKLYEMHRYTIDAQRSTNTKKAIDYFTSMISVATDPYSLVRFHYFLGLCYTTDKQTDKARECYSYVIDKGNTLFCVTQAKKALEKLK